MSGGQDAGPSVAVPQAPADLGPQAPVHDPTLSRFAWVNTARDVFGRPAIRWATVIVAALVLLLVPSLVENQYHLHIIIDVLIFVPLAVGQNLITGNTGQVAIGHAAFYGTGAYVVAILSVDHHWGTIPALVAAVVITAAIGLATGVPAIRISGDYLFIVTIGLNLIFLDIVTQWMGLTGGASGIPGVPIPSVFGVLLDSQESFYYLALAAAAAAVVVALLMTHSRFGKTMQAVRDDPVAAQSSGISIVRIRIAVFTVGAGMAGLSGGILAYQLGFVGPQSFQFMVSLLIFEMAIIGGLGNVFGSVVGATLLIALPELLRPIQDYRVGIGGLAILLLMVWRPQGLVGSVRMTSLVRR